MTPPTGERPRSRSDHSPHYVSLAEAAQRLTVSVDTLERHVRPALLAGAVASLKIGSRRVISWESLLAYLDENHNGAVQ